MSAIDEEHNRVLGFKLALIEELRHDLGSEGIQCPGIVVVQVPVTPSLFVVDKTTQNGMHFVSGLSDFGEGHVTRSQANASFPIDVQRVEPREWKEVKGCISTV